VVHKFGPNTRYLGELGAAGKGEGQFHLPWGLAVDALGDIYVADMGNNRIQEWDSRGKFLTAWGSFGAGKGQFKSPCGVAVDRSGNIYVADLGNHRIQKFLPN
jgi:tripartite motif-containing protein 71